MSLVDFINANVYMDEPLVAAVCIGIIFIVVHDFYHCLQSAVLSWFKK